MEYKHILSTYIDITVIAFLAIVLNESIDNVINKLYTDTQSISI